ncbi:RHS repeat-associated core domain-containing protein [Providencia stuartii]|uniref:RHS repeat-associated core domain-containing protein n=1 Tax=Providencia stuartii TaxID=588 RepID=UPI0018C48E85|nr:hypothetical protein [Providencia stuartii]MBG5909774.1 hypothetical protein [Providencia stuartii]HAU5736983.1 hypothetical protein [Providencia stuartii]HAU5775914.1 hypothetical protein [Providencia stuartii]HEM6896015.1 hypothetical protein [Providencia stuartii]
MKPAPTSASYFNKEVGLHYNTYHYYAPDLGRFIQRDSIVLVSGLNCTSMHRIL